jgi:hypothetical protein
VRQRLAPPFHLAESQIRREPGWLYKATGHRLPPISSRSCSFVILPAHGPTGVGRTVPLKLVRATAMQLFDGDPVEAICLSPAHDRLYLEAVAEIPSGPTRLTHGTGPSNKLSNTACRHVTMSLPNSYWNVWQCGRSDTPFKPHSFIPADVGNQDSALKI